MPLAQSNEPSVFVTTERLYQMRDEYSPGTAFCVDIPPDKDSPKMSEMLERRVKEGLVQRGYAVREPEDARYCLRVIFGTHDWEIAHTHFLEVQLVPSKDVIARGNMPPKMNSLNYPGQATGGPREFNTMLRTADPGSRPANIWWGSAVLGTSGDNPGGPDATGKTVTAIVLRMTDVVLDRLGEKGEWRVPLIPPREGSAAATEQTPKKKKKKKKKKKRES
ncbi:MAG: hypothetical protein GY716_13550 [bacterium]|nr:hypothetical protein [bacterium]